MDRKTTVQVLLAASVVLVVMTILIKVALVFVSTDLEYFYGNVGVYTLLVYIVEHYVRDADVGIWTVASYVLTLLLFRPSWRWTTRVEHSWLRIVSRASIVAALLTPSFLVDPAMAIRLLVPALLPAVMYAGLGIALKHGSLISGACFYGLFPIFSSWFLVILALLMYEWLRK